MLQRVIGNSIRNFNVLTLRMLSAKSEGINVVFKTKDNEYTGKGKLGESLLDVVINNDIPLDGFGACEGTIACCSCHVILEQEHYNRLQKPNDDELDMLDLAPSLEDTSRLGCQVILDKNDKPEIRVMVPDMTIDVRTL
ncbi:Adrenodoxin, mitochondrial [Strongyloides ratti]|uniref:Adrenodoxin, mitochondrial n=1 Tax=Strongyloides ratti TaxID=34506 RepID=A0A090LAA6_STRRB|nr:Adrenodoxin, mitochondrial [Strongyloides ratti]CEF64465.1 Adrenodoxin, mitochondrial [Strongyloides ratti]